MFAGVFRTLLYAIAALYPILVFYFHIVRGISVRMFSLFIMAFAVIVFLSVIFSRKNKKNDLIWPPVILFIVGTLCVISDSGFVLKFYPVVMNGLFLITFGLTLFLPPTMIFRFATLMDKSIKGSLAEKRIAAYCRKVTVMWCIFFIFNGSIAVLTIFSGSDVFWSVYNGVIAYILMGILFAVEYIVRIITQKKMPKSIPLSAFKKHSRDPSLVLCYEGAFNDGIYKTWNDFIQGTEILRKQINSNTAKRFILHCEDSWYFLLAFTALLQCKKEILLTANISPGYIAEIRGKNGDAAEEAFILTDQDSIIEEKNHFYIPDILSQIPKQEISLAEDIPVINADETSIVIYTSGSTGNPKAVKQRLTELENDNRFILSMWGEEFLKRKVCSTVNQHHIYGLLFSIFLPFTAGVPFKRERIKIPEELEILSDTEYMLITVPAFLKRASNIEKNHYPKLKSPFIFTSGGSLDPITAKKTSEVLGFWPVEIYGSTETSGIAWRQSGNGPEWKPFDNAQISLNKDSCLIIRSPYIKDPNGFETADLAQIYPDGRFILKGRIDSVVKIEEKRISLVEMEDRILSSGFASEVCVIPMEGKRQYLAAAIVLNDEGKKRFGSLEKHDIKKFWKEYLHQFFEHIVIPKKLRFLDVLPVNSQGKKNKEKIKLLFIDKTAFEKNTDITEKIIEKTDTSVTLEFSVPGSNPYFDGHFPEFKILPGVAQTELVIRYASRFLGTGIDISEIKRLKFASFIQPDTTAVLHLEKKENNISFKIFSLDKETAYSSGTLILRDGEVKN